MQVPIEIIIWALGVFVLLISGVVTVFWQTMSKTNEVIEKNTEAIISLQAKGEGNDRLCVAKHEAIDRTLQRHDKTLDRHEEEIFELKNERVK